MESDNDILDCTATTDSIDRNLVAHFFNRNVKVLKYFQKKVSNNFQGSKIFEYHIENNR